MKYAVFTSTKNIFRNMMSKNIILVALVFASSITFAQKKNTTNAAMAYKNSKTAFQAQKYDQVIKDLLEAKDAIDLAIAHPDTKSDAKTLKYKGMIYFDLALFGMASENEKVKALDLEKIAEEGINALKSVKENDSKGRYEGEVDEYCRTFRSQGYNSGVAMYKDGKYEEAMAGFGMSATFGEIIELTDSSSYFYMGLSAYNIKNWEVVEEAFEKCIEIGFKNGTSVSYLTEAYKQLDKADKAETMLNEQLVKHPGDKDIMISLINILLDKDKKVEAEKVLTDAIAVDPNNKDLHYAVATVYENLERYDDAEKAYLKVLELDPKYTNALLGLGAVYFNLAADYNNKIGDLQPGDPKEDEYRALAKENFKKSLPYLEKADELNPNNKEILNSLKQAYYKLGMIDEMKETKAKIEALK